MTISTYTLKEMREQRNLPMNIVSETLDISYQALRNWEQGNAVPNVIAVLELLAVYDYTFNELNLAPFYEYLNRKNIQKQQDDALSQEEITKADMMKKLEAFRSNNKIQFNKSKS